jgi:hypothetical protein
MTCVVRSLTLALVILAVSSAEDTRAPVIIELFTSEGCSSCPPADETLARLERTQPVSGARVIALEEHVDYWNQLGWQDRFSAPMFRARQNEYARLFQTENIYTPQMVVNGQVEFVGDDMTRAVREVAKAATAPSYGLRLQLDHEGKNPALMSLTVFVRSNHAVKPAAGELFLAVTESRLTSNVLTGENGGRTLRHAPVVRSFGIIGSLDARQFNEVGVKSTLKIPDDWNREHLHAVVFVQDRASHRITAATVTDLR